VEVQVTVKDGHLARIGEVAAALEDAGLRDPQVLDAIGVITGAADALEPLQDVDGVLSAEPSGEVDIGPPDAPVQ
jgi:hypothetical protein